MKTKSHVDKPLLRVLFMPKSDFFKWTYLDVNQQANLFCALALGYDKSIRRHRFRDRARTIVNNLPKTQRVLLTAYTHGVNQGLLFLVSQTFEYLLLQQGGCTME